MVYNAQNQLTGVIAPGATTASPTTSIYDAAGNITIDTAAGNQYVYDGEGRVCASFSTDSTGYPIYTGYVYDAEGNRVAKGTIRPVMVNGTPTLSCDITQNGLATAGDETDYILGPGGEQVTEMAQQSDGTMLAQRIYVYAGGSLVGTYDTPSETTAPVLSFRLTDWLGTMRATTDSAGVFQGSCTGLPFGDGVSCSGNIPDNHHFTGKERDPETGGLKGNDYFGARYYASSMGHWLSPDWSAKVMPVPYAKLDDPQTLNLYNYMRNNPLAGVDPDGHCPSWMQGVCDAAKKLYADAITLRNAIQVTAQVGIGAKVNIKFGGIVKVHIGASLHVEVSDNLYKAPPSENAPKPDPVTIKAEVDAGAKIPHTPVEVGGEAGFKETPGQDDKSIHRYATPEAKMDLGKTEAGTDLEKYSIGGSVYDPEAYGLGGGLEFSAPKDAVTDVVNDVIDTAKQIGAVIQDGISNN